MRLITFISALLFACVLIAAGALGYWSYAINQFEKQLPAYLGEFPGKFKFERLVKSWHPTEMQVVLKGVSWSYLDVEKGSSAVVQLGDIKVDGNLFGASNLVARMDQDVLFTLKHKGHVQRYRLDTNSAVVNFDLDPSNSTLFSSANVLMLHKEVRGKFEPIVQTGYVYVGSASEKPMRWSISVNDMQYYNVGADLSRVDNIAFTWKLVERPNVNLINDFVLWTANKSEFSDVLGGWTRPAVVDISDGRISYGDKWYALKGRVGLGHKGFTEADIVVSTNQFNVLLDGVRQSVGLLPLALDRMMRRVMKNQGAFQGLNLVVRSGKLYINGSPVGDVPSVLNVLDVISSSNGRES